MGEEATETYTMVRHMESHHVSTNCYLASPDDKRWHKAR